MAIVLDNFSKSLLKDSSDIKLDAFSKTLLDSTPDVAPQELSPIEQMKAQAAQDQQRIVADQFDQMAQETLKLPPEQRNAAINSPVVDTLTGGMTLPQADANATAQIDRYKAIPKETLDILKTLTAGGVFNPNQPQATPFELLDTAGKAAGVAATPFIPAAGGIEGILKGLMTGQNPATTAVRGMVDPASAPLMSSPETVPLQPFERQGGIETLIPRAIAQGVEQLALGHAMGAPGEIKKGYETAKTTGAQKDFEADFAKHATPDAIQAKMADLPGFKDLTPEQQAIHVDDATKMLKSQMLQNPEIGDYYMGKQTFGKLLGDAEMSLRDMFKVDLPLKPGERGSTGVPEEPANQKENAPTFYSKLEQTVNDKIPNNASPEQIMNTLLAAGVKQDEIDWTDTKDFLAGKTKVSKQDLIDHVKQNQVQIQDVEKSDKTKNYTMDDVQYQGIEDRNGVKFHILEVPDNVLQLPVSQYPTKTDAMERALQKTGGMDETKFKSYQLPGGENYREHLLTLPSKDAKSFVEPIKLTKLPDGYELIHDTHGKLDKNWAIIPPGQVHGKAFAGWHMTEEAAKKEALDTLNFNQRYEAEKNYEEQNKGVNFKSGHFDEPNVLAHVRMNDRTDSEGKKVLHIEEVQSDWHQKGRKQGYKTDSHIDKAFQQGVPDAPFKKTWHELAMKRMLRYAAENGYDKLAWTTGEQQVERYDLSKQVNEIRYYKAGDSKYQLIIKYANGQSATPSVESDKLEDYVGKEVAQKILNGEGIKDRSERTLSGLDLKVGGEGMKGFYDQILPSFVNKYTKKWGGKVTQGNLGKIEDSYGYPVDSKVHSVDITPSMRQSVLKEGQPMFEKQGEMFPGGKVTEGPDVPREKIGKQDLKNIQKVKDISGLDNIINVKYLLTAEGQKIFGMYQDMLMTIPQGAALRTYLHEMKHSIFDMFLDAKEKEFLIDAAVKHYGVSRDKAEEKLAQKFTEFAGEGATPKDTNWFFNKVKGIFQRLLYKIKKFLKMGKTELEDFYNKILEGKYKEAKVKEPGGGLKKESAEDIWDKPAEKEIIKSEEQPIQDKAEMEISMLSNGNAHPLEQAMKGYKLKPYKGGHETEEFAEIPKRFVATGDKGMTVDDARTEIAGQSGIEFDSDSDFIAALKALGNEQKKFGFSDDVKQFLKVKENVDAIGKKLDEKLGPGKVKRVIHSYVGVKKPKTDIIIQTTEQQVLKHMLKVREKASKEGYVAGRKEVKQEVRDQNKLKREEHAKKVEEAKRFTPEQRKELYQKAYSKGLIIKLENGHTVDRLQGILSHYKDASFDEIKNLISQLQGSQENPKPKILKLYGDANTDAEAMKFINEVSGEWRDINNVEIGTLDPIRAIEKVTGLDAWDDNNILMHNTFDVIAGADATKFDEYNAKLKELHEVAGGILADTKASADIMERAETGGTLTAKEQKLVDYIKAQNAELFTRDNAVRAKTGRKPIAHRQNYLTHMRETNLLMKLFNGDAKKIESLTTEQLDALRKSGFTKPNAKFNPHSLKREGEKTKYDLIGNYEKYLELMLRDIHMSPAISHARKFSEYALLKLPHMYELTNELFQNLVDKPSSFDKAPIWRNIVSNKVVKWVRGQIAKNALIGNLSFNLVNFANFTTGTGELGNYVLKGMHKFLSDPEMRALAFKNSSVLQSRKSQFDADVKAISVFNPKSFENLTAVEKAKAGAKQLQFLIEGLTRTIEYNNVGSTWVGAYMKAVEVHKFSPAKAMKYADTIARRTQVGYRPYELPAAMRSDTGKLFLQFQSWTFNAMNHLIYDLKLGNIPKQIAAPFTKDNTPSPVRYRDFIVLLGVMMLVNEIYKKLGLREPTSVTSVTPRISFPVGRVIKDAATVTGADNLIKQAAGGHPSKHKEETITKAKTHLLTSIAAPYGGVQISRFMEGSPLPKNDKYAKKDAADIYEKAMRTDDQKQRDKLWAEADQLSVEKRVLKEDAQDTAEKRVRKEIEDTYEQAITRGDDPKILEKADTLGKTAKFDEDELDQMYNVAKKRIEKRGDKAQDIEDQSRTYKPRPGIFDEAKKLMESFK